MRYHFRLSQLVSLLLVLAAPAWSAYPPKQLAPGVTLTQDVCTDPQKALITNVVTINPAVEGVSLKATLAQDIVMTDDWRKGREGISALTARKGALVGVNADFFPFTGDPIGVCVTDGQLISEPALGRACLAVLRDKSVVFDIPRFDAAITFATGATRKIDGINRVRDTNQLVIYTDAYGASTVNKYKATDVVCTCGDLPIQAGKTATLTVTEVKLDAVNTPIPKGGVVLSAGGPAASFLKENVKPGDQIMARFEIKSTGAVDWSQVDQAVGGGPWLVKQGKPFIDTIAEGFDAGFSSTCHPRTAAGVTCDGKLLIVTVDGRQAISRGISLPDLANLMIGLGAVTAINLDGGGSTTLSVRGFAVNSVSEGEERPVADALLVYGSPPPTEELPKLAIAGITPEVISGQGSQLSLVYGDDAKPLSPEQAAKVVWGTGNSVGFVNQMGYFTPGKLRNGSINAIYGSQIASIPVSVVAGPPAKLKLSLTADKTDPNRATISVAVYDANSNALVAKEVLLNVAGGRPDVDSGTTDDKGQFSTSITWDPVATDRVVVAVVGQISAEARPEVRK